MYLRVIFVACVCRRGFLGSKVGVTDGFGDASVRSKDRYSGSSTLDRVHSTKFLLQTRKLRCALGQTRVWDQPTRPASDWSG